MKNKVFGGRIYSDFDHVFHNYMEVFYEELEKSTKRTLNQEGAPNPVNLNDIPSFFGIPEWQYKEVLDFTSAQDHWRPTPFAYSLLSYMKNHMDNGGELIIVTARPFREGVDTICKNLLEYDVPVISCKSEHKHLVMQDGALIFEDHPQTAIECANRLPSSHVIVPCWEWNEYLLEEGPANLTVLHQSQISKDLGFYINRALEGNEHFCAEAQILQGEK